LLNINIWCDDHALGPLRTFKRGVTQILDTVIVRYPVAKKEEWGSRSRGGRMRRFDEKANGKNDCV